MNPNEGRSDSTDDVLKIDAVLADERKLLRLGKGRSRRHASALCFSGGGIRSATFCLGVLQGLAKLGRLRDFHYLSVVSGGAYIGAWLAAWIARSQGQHPSAFAHVCDQLVRSVECGTDAEVGQHEPKPIKRLRAYSSFLSPVRGLSADLVSATAILVRNLLLNWIVVIPVMLAVLLLPRVVSAWLTPDRNHGATAISASGDGIFWAWAAWIVPILLVFLAVAFASSRTQLTKKLDEPPTARQIERATTPKGSAALSVHCCFVAPLILAAFAMIHANRDTPLNAISACLSGMATIGAPVVAAFTGALVHAVGTLVGASWRLGEEWPRRNTDSTPRTDLAWHIGMSALTGAIAGTLVYFILNWMTVCKLTPSTQTTFGVPLLLAALGLTAVLRAGLLMRWTREETREWWGRASALAGTAALAWLILSLLVLQLPEWLLGWASTWSVFTAGMAGVGSVLVALATVMFGFWSKHGTDIKEKARGISRSIGVHSLELAALASMVFIALCASLLLGAALTRPPFMSQDDVRHHRSAIQSELGRALLLERAKSPADKQCEGAAMGCRKVETVQSSDPAAAGQCSDLKFRSENPRNPDGDSTTGGQAIKVDLTKESSDQYRLDRTNNVAGRWRVQHLVSLELSRWGRLAMLAAALLAVACFASMLFGANAFSLNAFYGNRLTRAYLGASRDRQSARPDPFTGFDRHDNLPLKDLTPASAWKLSPRPLLVINTALNLIRASGDRLEWQERKAASFFMTPLHCGSDVVDYVRTDRYASTPNGLSVGRAMAISGAAASPSMGHHSSMFVSMLMSFFNVRLGWWMPNPRVPAAHQKEEPSIGLWPILREMTSGAGESKDFVYLSDGGHFENLGVYEMVRRRCRRILVVDAGCDPGYEYEDLENAIRKIRTDFGIEITFGPLLQPGPGAGAGGHCCRGTIHYSRVGRTGDEEDNEEDGEIILIKPILSGDEPVDLLRYAATTRSDGRVFPQQPTSDQFFDEAQFESYRKLGLHSVLEAFRGARGRWPTAGGESAPTPVHAAATGTHLPHKASAAPRWQAKVAEEKGPGLLSMLGSMAPISQAALLASAITITAAISVTGTVTLSNPEVTLKTPGDLTAVVSKESGAAFAAGVDGYFNHAEPGEESRHEALVKELRAELEKLTNITRLVKLELTGTPDAAWTTLFNNVNNAFSKLDTAISSLDKAAANLTTAAGNINDVTDDFRVSLRDSIGELNNAAGSLEKTAETLNSNADEIKLGLRIVADRLGKIEQKVQSISPRQTVRGNGS